MNPVGPGPSEASGLGSKPLFRSPAGSSSSNQLDRDRRRRVSAVSDDFGQLLRSFTKARARMLQNAQNDVDSAAHVLLRVLDAEGAMRVSALADSVGADVSTVSRQVATLVNEGLLERHADLADGRACVLALTEAGRSIIAAHTDRRLAFYDRVLDGWTADELDAFSSLLARFAVDYERATSSAVLAPARAGAGAPAPNPASRR